MAVAFLVQERQMHGIFLKMGEKCIDWALQLQPDCPDALLLAGWYAFSQDRAQSAISLARKALEADPQNAKIWLGLGFFLTKAQSPSEAVSAFDKVIALYPGYSNRPVIERVSADLKKGESPGPVSQIRDGSNTKAEARQTPSS